MNAVRQVIEKAKSNQKEVAERMSIKQNTLSRRMNKEVQGTIEWSLEVAKELGVRSYTIVRDGYEIRIKRRG